MEMQKAPGALPDHSRRTAVVTGGTDGIGKQIALELASHGLRVLIVGRAPVKGARAEAELQAFAQNRCIPGLQ